MKKIVMEPNKKWTYLLLFVLIVLGIFAIIKSRNKLNNIKKNIAFTQATVTAYHASGGHGGNSIEFKYIINRINSNRQVGTTLKSDIADEIVGKKFPLVYSKTNESNVYILITPEDFKEFNLVFPDSLNWINRYLK